MNRKTLYGTEARNAVLNGVRKIVDAVKVTLGPQGRNVLISQSMIVDYGVHNLPIRVTKDGVSVAQAFELADEPFEKAGVLMVKEAAQKTVDQAGDGTTTCCVLLEAIVREGAILIEQGANPMEVKKSIDKSVEGVVAKLKEMAIPIKGNIERIRQIATVSANNDPEIGGWIAKAFEKIGDEGVIDIEESKGVSTSIKISDGYKFNKGWVSPLFMTNKDKQVCELEKPLILLYDKRVIHHTQVQRALELAIQHNRPVLIICEDAAEEGLAVLAMNNVQGRIKCCVVKAPSFGDGRREEMEDIAIVTGGSYISDIRGLSVKEMELDNFGEAKKAIVTKDETVIIGGISEDDAVENLLNELRMNLVDAKNEDEKYPIEKRIARLTGGVAVIQVGAATETEMKEKLDRFDDAVRATKAAISEGYVAGGGTAFIRCINEKAPSGMNSDDIYKGRHLIDTVLDAPLTQILKNSGVDDPKFFVEEVIKATENWGYNAKDGGIENLIESGIIDPVKVLRCALQNAASSAGMILTCEAVIADTM